MKWQRLKHNGITFPPPPNSVGLSIRIKGKKVRLTPEQEEMAIALAGKKDTPYMQDEVFFSNFLSDFLKTLPTKYSNSSWRDIDFSEVFQYVDKEKQKKALLTREEKKRLSEERKQRRLKLKDQYGYAEVNGKRYEIANWMAEPPCIFVGRGNHPLRGRWKPRIHPKDVTLNLGEEAEVPEGDWKDVVHDHNSMWLACWLDKLSNKVKYVWLTDAAPIRQTRDRLKFDTAGMLETRIDGVRKQISKGMREKDIRTRKVASVCYLIDKLCMRVGDEKEEDEADTVGASTLRVEHVTVNEKSVYFDFLGKDSVRWQSSLPEHDSDSKLFSENIRQFTLGKDKTDLVFDGVNSSQVNRFLGDAMRNLTAKVFRTYHATKVVKEYLVKVDCTPDSPEYLKIFHAKQANLAAAIRCNHKRTPPKNWETSLAKRKERLNILMNQEPKTDKAKTSLAARIEKLKLTIELIENTRDYNLNTSLRNYIDPRVYKAWGKSVALDWTAVYPKTLQRKFSWVNRVRTTWPL